MHKCSDAGGPQVTCTFGWVPWGRIQLLYFLRLHEPNETDTSMTKKEDFGIKKPKTSACQVALWSLPRHKQELSDWPGSMIKHILKANLWLTA